MRLDRLSPRLPAYVETIDWAAMSGSDSRRLREFGLCEGASVEVLHRGIFGRGPIACRIGRMIVAMRADHAGAITVRSQDEVGEVASRYG